MNTYRPSPELQEFIATVHAIARQLMAWLEANRPAIELALANSRQITEAVAPYLRDSAASTPAATTAASPATPRTSPRHP